MNEPTNEPTNEPLSSYGSWNESVPFCQCCRAPFAINDRVYRTENEYRCAICAAHLRIDSLETRLTALKRDLVRIQLFEGGSAREEREEGMDGPEIGPQG